MAIAQMNWVRMRYPLDNPRMREFTDKLDEIYRLAEQADGFIWRICDNQIATELLEQGYDEMTSATVSVWQTVSDLRCYTFESAHGTFLDRADKWFEPVEGPQLVIWEVDEDAQPSFRQACERLDHLKVQGSSEYAHGWL